MGKIKVKPASKLPSKISGTSIDVMGNVPRELWKSLVRPGGEWKYATTEVRENQAIKLGSVFFNKDLEDVLTSPASPNPEKHKIIPREKIKPRFEK